MSVVQDLEARARGGADQIPVDVAMAAADRLLVASELLAWVRRSSQHQLGLPELSGAVEHLEQAVHAMHAAREAVAEYLAALGLADRPPPPPPAVFRPAPAAPPGEEAPPQQEAAVPPLRRWWSARVDELTGAEATTEAERTRHTGESGDADPSGDPAAGTTDAATARRDRRVAERERAEAARHRLDPAELLRRVAGHVRSGDRAALRAELRRADPPAGLGMSTSTPALLRRLSEDLLGHPPGPDDLGRLRDAAGGRVRQLLPGLPVDVPESLLGRVCRVPPPKRRPPPEAPPGAGSPGPGAPGGEPERGTHPTDSAVTGAVLVGVLLERLGRDTESLRRLTGPPEPARG